MNHSPEPWTYDEQTRAIRDAQGQRLAWVTWSQVWEPTEESLACLHANGHRIASLSAENARLREALQAAIPEIPCGAVLKRMRHQGVDEYKCRCSGCRTLVNVRTALASRGGTEESQ